MNLVIVWHLLTSFKLLHDSPLWNYDSKVDIRELRSKRSAVTITKPAGDDYFEEDRKIPMRDDASIMIRVHQPKVIPPNGCPGLVIYHGGGYCLGGLQNETELSRRWVDLGGVAINVDYRLAPEFPFPIPVHDAYDALKWVS